MINFREKLLILDLMPKAIKYLTLMGVRPNIISRELAPEVSKVNSKAMVLVEFIKNLNGRYLITLMDKGNGTGGPYPYTQKLIGELFRMNVINIGKRDRTITADTEHYGIIMDIIEVLAYKYNLSVVA